ncbi:MAG: C10 family peptidase [Prevotella sp.]|nr:C10 family peptidase [Prevotella sp.]
MKKYIISIVCALCAMSGTAWAGPVDSQTAKQKAAAFLQKQAVHAGNARRAAALRAPQLSEAKAFGEALHVFNVAGDNGFVIVSGDDRTEEILGYVEGGSFDPNNMPDNMRFWLQMYADQIRSLGSADVQKGPRREAKATINKLMTTKWDQSGSYRCMLLDDVDEAGEPENLSYYKERILTGCVATAMAQVLYNEAKNYKAKHGSWPDFQTNEIPAYSPGEGSLTGHTLPALPPIKFDWANMRDNYSTIVANDITPEQEVAVGRLMQYCGRSVKMEYSDVSGALVIDVPPAMSQYLNMNPYVQSVDRAYFNSEEWEDMLYNEFANGRAVVYGATVGTSYQSEGHCFVLDGYKDGLFHVNWGWGLNEAINKTEYDGFFSLSILKPGGGGSGAASDPSGAEYKYNQQAVINISYEKPAEVNASLNFYWKSKSSVYTSTIYASSYGTYNVFGSTLNFDGGWAIRNADGSLEFLHQDYDNKPFNSIQVADGVTTYMSDLGIASKADGDYDLVHVSRVTGTEKWFADNGTDKNYITVTVAGGSVSKVLVHPVDPANSQFSVTNIEFIGDMEANKENIVRVTIKNTGDDYFGKISMGYGTGTTASSVLSMLATLKPGETTHDFTVKAAKGEYNLWFMFGDNSSSSAFGTGKMFIGYGADANKIKEGKLEFDGQEGATTLSVKSVNGQLAPVTGTFEIVNSSTNKYTNTYYLAVENGTTTYATASVAATVDGNSTETISFNLGTVTGLTSGTTYTIRLYKKNGDTEVNVASKNLSLQPYFRYWLADGSVKEFAETSNSNKLSGDGLDAIAIDCRGISKNATMYMDGVKNKNCLFYIEEAQRPTSSSYSTYGRNLVIDGVAEKMTVDAAYAFYAPEAFTAKEISYVRTFANGNNDDGKGWETIVLPFEVNSVKQGTKNISWFHSATDKRKHFWLMELTGADAESLTFDYATAFEANKPYIISVPGNKWGDNWNLAGKEITFRGVNVEVPATVLEPVICGGKEFTPTFATISANGYIMNAEGTEFKKGEGTVNGYNAYFAAEGTANALRIVIEGEEATGIEAVDNSQLTNGNEPIFNLNGQRLEQKQRGVNIVGGRKIVVK